MKLKYIDLCGFRGYKQSLRIEFASGFNIIDGRNGVGKSTLFDAVEFVLTGSIAKYGEIRADGETVADYIWWNGGGEVPPERYVEIGFSDGENDFSLKRSQLHGIDQTRLDFAKEQLCDAQIAPQTPLNQLCTSSIIRDEHIATLSLDLKEADRYTLLCDAIGATDADKWIKRGASLVSSTKKRVQNVSKEVEEASKEVISASRRIDEIRSLFVEESILSNAVSRLQTFTGTTAPPDQLIEPTRVEISKLTLQLEQFEKLNSLWTLTQEDTKRLPDLEKAYTDALRNKHTAEENLSYFDTLGEKHSISNEIAKNAKALMDLVSLGRNIGLRSDNCPLCNAKQTEVGFLKGLDIAEQCAKELDERSVEYAKYERERAQAEENVISSTRELDICTANLKKAKESTESFEQYKQTLGLEPTFDIESLPRRCTELSLKIDTAHEDLRVVETLKMNASLERAKHTEAVAKEQYSIAQEKLGLARRAETYAHALHVAALRAEGETLNRRLEQVLPLMAELYRRLRPHPIWNDIECKIRGDVKRFMKLQVGDEELNPQFMFSSGQRRSTGLAFLLSVNLSIAWSRWQTVMLDDPVQHVDDFRSIHLAEVLAQLSKSGRQIICAVEDAALADLLCRRLPVQYPGHGKRITLGPKINGAIDVLGQRDLSPFPDNVLSIINRDDL